MGPFDCSRDISQVLLNLFLLLIKKFPKALSKCDFIVGCIPDHGGICGLIEVLCQPLHQHHFTVHMRGCVTKQLISMRLSKTDVLLSICLSTDNGFTGNKPSTVVDLFGNTPQIIYLG